MKETVTITIHVGTGELGKLRKQALEMLAAKAGHVYNGKPSIGRWLVTQADAWIDKTKNDIAKGTKS